MNLLEGVRAESVTSEDGVYRFRLERMWDPSQRHLVWIMLCPTLAAAGEDDRCLRKLQALTRKWEWGGVVVVNLFALRCRGSYELKQHCAPVGAFNDLHILNAARSEHARAVICAWGNVGRWQGRSQQVVRMLRDNNIPLWRMGGPLTRFDEPWVPTRFPLDALPVPWQI